MELILPSQALTRVFVGENLFLKQDDHVSTVKTKSYHAFTIGEIGLLIPSDTSSEFAEDLCYCQLPNTNTVLYGMANLRGSIIPVFDMYEQLGVSVEHDAKGKVLVVGDGSKKAAIIIDKLPVRLSVTENDEFKGNNNLPAYLKKQVEKCYLVNERFWYEIDMISLYRNLSQFV